MLFKKIKNIIKSWKIHSCRHIPNQYFKGYRRLANSQEEINTLGKFCWTCRHSVAFIFWHCDIPQKCTYEQCYVKSELTKADYYAGYFNNNWIGLPGEDIILK